MKRALAVSLLMLAIVGSRDLDAKDTNSLNVLVITADTLRAEAVESTYTPNLDRLAQEGARFDRAYTAITTTLPSHASIFSSLYPQDHRAYSNVSAISSRVTMLPEILKPMGWRTGAHINMPWLNPDVSNVPQGFQDIRRGDHVRKADKTNPWVRDWLQKRSEVDQPWMLWVHYVDNHTPYHAPGPYEGMYPQEPSTKLADIWSTFPPDHQESEYFIDWLDGVEHADEVVGDYYGSVTWVDQHVGQIIWDLQQSGEWEDTLIVFTADHGESMGEHDLWFVHAGLYEQTVRVPLIVRVPGSKAHTVDTVVSTVDIVPTILGQIGLPAPDEARGEDLWPLVESGVSGGGAAYLEHTGKQLEGVVTSDWKYVAHRKTNRIYSGYPMNEGTEELYDLSKDPEEQRNLASEHPEKITELIETMDRLKSGDRGFEELQGQVDEDVRETLRALGYMD
ncbi:MAG: sulfatase-like hydrolase/transferase [Proteobacteria bacterium]|nr:sulfatase-like hydrolase/transferase [Pseudomonadota bacterium]MCP4920005.1 sulfatase-like hydrolase/transferase [Pseudomonadota bacterium]